MRTSLRSITFLVLICSGVFLSQLGYVTSQRLSVQASGQFGMGFRAADPYLSLEKTKETYSRRHSRLVFRISRRGKLRKILFRKVTSVQHVLAVF